MDFQTAVRTCLQKYVTFSGRASRSEYWYFVLFIFLGQILLGIVDNILFHTGHMSRGPGFVGYVSEGGPLGGLFSLAVLLPAIAAGARRLHDQDKSGWWLLIAFIPLIGSLVLLYFFVQPSTPGPNRFGGQRTNPTDYPAQPWGAPQPPAPPADDYAESNVPKVPRD